MAKSCGTKESVLVPTGLGPSRTYPTIRSLARRGINTIVASEHDKPPVFASKLCGERLRLPAPDTDLVGYKNALLGIAARPDVRTVVPAREEDAYVLSKYRDEFEAVTDLVVPPFEVLKRSQDRLRLATAAEEAGAPVPKTRLLSEVDDWEPELIIKSRYNLLADGYVDTHSPKESSKVKNVMHLSPGEMPDFDAIREKMKHDPIVQEYVTSSDEYMFAALYDHGEPLATFQHRQVRGDSYIGGGGVYRKSVYIEELEEVARKLLGHLDWHGLACVEYMRDAETGEFKLTEINPRMWQSLPATVHAGADFPYHYWQAATGEAHRIDSSYDIDSGSHSLRGELGYVLSLFRDDSPHVERPTLGATVRELVSSLREDPHFDYTHADDLGPFFSGVDWMVRNRL
ncbi:ATP-grasp domain-containing protein [Haloprofundus halobius]|uniref:carboxylate--amine ligase n=1 Tax=Haloprofundus halobius TaxID=2876194 RepID=UPI001CCA1141|nr:ATP-grasp domain-containing protein [Haloprofundus halobius]